MWLNDDVETDKDGAAILSAGIYKMYCNAASNGRFDELELLCAFSLVYKNNTGQNAEQQTDPGAGDADKIDAAINTFIGSTEARPSQPTTVRWRLRALVTVSELSAPSPAGVRYRTGLVILPANGMYQLAQCVEGILSEAGLDGTPVMFHGSCAEDAFLWVMRGPTTDPELLQEFLDH